MISGLFRKGRTSALVWGAPTPPPTLFPLGSTATDLSTSSPAPPPPSSLGLSLPSCISSKAMVNWARVRTICSMRHESLAPQVTAIDTPPQAPQPDSSITSTRRNAATGARESEPLHKKYFAKKQLRFKSKTVKIQSWRVNVLHPHLKLCAVLLVSPSEAGRADDREKQ